MRQRALLSALLLVLLAACARPAAPTAMPTEATAPPTATALPPTAAATAVPTATTLPPRATPGPTRPPTYSGAQPPAEASLGETWLRPADGMMMVYVPAGTFLMGSDPSDPKAKPDELPQHQVTVDGFWIDQLEVDNGQFTAFLNVHGNRGERGVRMIVLDQGYNWVSQEGDTFQVRPALANYPISMVTWYGAQAYCQWVGGRLPTEAEWEYAARGPEGNPYPWGDEAPTCDRANFGDCSRSLVAAGTRPAGASWCGAQEMAGGDWEWVADWFGPYPSGPQDNPTGPSSGFMRVMRGGGWHSPWWEIRSTARLHDTAPSSYNG